MDHQLTLVEATPYVSGSCVCNLCFLASAGPVYHCSVCQYDIHPGCAATASTEGHFLHEKHMLRRIDSNGEKRCNGCGLMANSACYNCPSPCDFSLHPICARAPMYVKHPFHTHILELTPETAPTMPAAAVVAQPCLACDRKLVVASSYRCTVCMNIGLHLGCLQLPWSPMVPSHPDHRMRLVPFEDSFRVLTCNECRKSTGSKWVYRCPECPFNLHTNCANVPHHSLEEFVAVPSSQRRGAGMHQTIRDIILKRHRARSSTKDPQPPLVET